MKQQKMLFSFFALLIFTLSGCGGGGGGGGGTTSIAPSIVSQPASQSVVAGNNASYTVVASGTGVSYQWQVNTGTGFADIANSAVYTGATTATLTITGAVSTMNGYQYRVVVSGAVAPAATSSSASLTVTATPVPPSITGQPANQSVTPGNNAVFTVSAAGTSPLTYQWQVNTGSGFTDISNSTLYSGATTSSLHVTGVTNAMNGYSYRVVINGAAAPAATSASATLNVTVTKAILTVSTANVPSGTLIGGVQLTIVLPAGVTPSVLSGNDASGSVAASGSAASGTLVQASYNAISRTLTLGAISGSGFASGEFATINTTVAAGTAITGADFPTQATVISIADSNTNSIPGATCPISVALQ